jgi:hypothetical protein
VHDNLLRGSRVPQYISQTDFDAIVNSVIETGR